MKKFVIVSMIILSALSLFGQKHDKIYFSGSVKGLSILLVWFVIFQWRE